MSDIGLGFRRNADESWKEAMLRIASRWGLEQECLDEYNAGIEFGDPEENAAYSALYAWDILDLYVDGEPVKGAL